MSMPFQFTRHADDVMSCDVMLPCRVVSCRVDHFVDRSNATQQVQAHQRCIHRGHPCVSEEGNGGHALADLVYLV